MKVTLIITDTPSGNCNMEAKFEPPITRAEIPKSNAGRVCLKFLEFMKGNAKSVECTSVTTAKK